MSNLQGLLETYRNDVTINQFVTNITNKDIIKLSGVAGAQDAFVLNTAFHASDRPHIYIASDKEEAAYYFNTIDHLTDGLVCFFPDSFRKPGNFEEVDRNNILLRTEVMNKVSLKDASNLIIVSYPEAIFEKVVDPKWLEAKKILISVGEDLDVDTIIEVLNEYDFERVEFVYEPGQFSIRGGIVDIFSYGNDWPYRVELFDEEVESIRAFDPSNQLSVRNLKKVSIVPNMSRQFERSEKVSLFDVFDESLVCWIKNEELLVEKMQICFEQATEFAKKIRPDSEEELKDIFNARTFIYPHEIIEAIADKTIVQLSNSIITWKPTKTFDQQVSPQAHFNKNFNLLIEDLQSKQEAGYTNYLFTENPRQIERFYSIFEDLDAMLDFHPIDHAIHAGFVDDDRKIACYTDHQIFERFYRYKLKRGFTKEQAINLKMLRELVPGDFVTHIDHGVGRYSGLEKINISGHIQESVRLIYQNNDILYVSINSLHKISKFVGKDGTAPKLSKIGGEAWKNLKRKTKKKVKDIAKELIKLYAKRKASQGFAFPQDGYLQNELEASFIYEDTPDQYEASEAVKDDMSKAYPMDRLVCGDVGFGKTEIAVRAAFKAVVGGKQVAILVPTTILALQHYKTFSDRLSNFGAKVDYINRFRTTKEKTQIFKNVEDGKVDILIGTHAILNKKVKFKDLGLLVIDEEQKFGVAAKEKLRNLKVNVDTLTLTATPIPRTLQFSLMAARDLSIIRTPPPNRQPIHTERRIFNDELIKEAIYYEINRGGQVFFVHNRVKSLADIGAMIKRLCPDIDVAMAHGQMDPKQLEKTLLDFINNKYDVLVCTNIIETGLDIPNANTMIINNAHQFGMSDLHQLRGRVGRSNKKAYCYLFAPPLSTMTSDARKRIKTLEEFSDLGSGFHIAMKDLDIRGAGNLLGGEQSGFISDIGYETYQKILEEAIHELKENEFKNLFKEELEQKQEYVREVEIDADVEMLIPDEYVNNIQERLNLYTELDQIENNDGITDFKKRLIDRFGPLPIEVDQLFNGLRLRWICKSMGFERLVLKNKTLRCFFVSNPQSPFFESLFFSSLLSFVSTKGPSIGLSLKQTDKYLILIKNDIKDLKAARVFLEHMKEDI